MKPRKQLRRWRACCARLLLDLSRWRRRAAARGGAEAVHQLRVTLRRLRLYVRAGRPLLEPAAVEALRRWGRQIAELTGPLRDLDVALGSLRAQSLEGPAVRRLRARRDRLWRARQSRLAPLAAGVGRRLASVRARQKAPATLARRLSRFEARLRRAVRTAAPGFFSLATEEQHNLRRAVRWWRYLRELRLPERRQKGDALLACLLHAQEVLGARQNWSTTLALLDGGKAPGLGLEAAGTLAAELAQSEARILPTLKTLGRFAR